MKKLPLAALFGTAFICLSVSPVVLAEEPDSLDNIVVTADRKARTVDETLAPVSIITRKDIEKYQATSIPEVLRRVPGVSISNNGGAGKTTSVYLRGTASGHVLVLIDGVKVGSATLGSTAFENLPLDQVERIEVVRGPRSSLYGSEAIGGVVQIFTRKGGKGFQPEISISTGSHNTQKANVNLAGGDKTTWYNLNAGTEKTDGINATTNNLEPDLDGYRRESASLRIGHRFANDTEVELSTLRAQGNNHFDGSQSGGNENNFTQQALMAKVKRPIGERVVLTGQVGQSLDKSYYYFNGGNLFSPFFPTSRQFDTRTDTASLQADLQTSTKSSLTVGADRQSDHITSDNAYTKKSRANDALFASYQHQFGMGNVEVSARQDDNEQFGKHNTGAIAVGHDFANGVRVTASHGTAFKAPTFNSLYLGGNPNLRPETSRNTEIGLQGRAGGASKWAVAAFNNQITDYIEWEEFPEGSNNWTANNVQPTIKGVEGNFETKVGHWDIAANATFQNPKKRSGAYAGNQMVNIPQKLANLDVDRKVGKLAIGASIHAEDTRYSAASNSATSKLPGYGTLDLRADYKLSKDWTVGAKIGNVLDKQYETNKGYNQDGINGLVTVKYAPK